MLSKANTESLVPTKLSEVDLARLSPAGYAMYASGGQWKIAKHLAYLNRHLLLAARRDIKRLMISMPPRHGKSELVSKYLPGWVMGALKEKVILTSYEAKFAAQWGTFARNLYNEHGETVFGSKLNPDFTHAEHWQTTEGGVMYTAGVGGPLTGKGCDWLIIDDPIKNYEEAMSATIRMNTAEWFRSTAYTRLEPNGVVVLMMTRWHEEDLCGVLLDEQPEKWTVIEFPAIAEEHDVLGRQPGDALWPERWPVAELHEIESTLRDQWWNALYRQKPTSKGGNKIKGEWWQRYETLPPFERVVISWDTASVAKKGNAFSVAAVWGVGKLGYYLIEVRRGRVEFPELLKWAKELGEQYPGCLNIIEDASTGTPLSQMLISTTRLNVLEVTVHKDKEARLNTVLNMIEGRRCFLPVSAPWLHDFEQEHKRFPGTTFKDQVDTTSMVLAWFRETYNQQEDEMSLIGGNSFESQWTNYLFPGNELYLPGNIGV